MVAVGINLFMSLYGLSVFLETSEPLRKGRKRYITASFAITTLFAFTASLDMANIFQPLFNSTSPTDWSELMALDVTRWKFITGHVSAGLYVAIGDALLVYRCYIVCVEYRWLTILPALTTLAGLALFITQTFLINDKLSAPLFSACIFLTVSTNIIVTALITFRLLRARRALEKVLPSADMRVYTSVIAILVESAAPLTIIGIVTAIVQQWASAPRTLAFHVCNMLFQGLFYIFCTLSPHMIIFRVTTGRSFTQFPTPKEGVVSNSLQFAHSTAESSFLQSTFNQGSEQSTDCDTEKGQGDPGVIAPKEQ
ncbi:hypothetical protein MD484_g6701, partial [Candolleomyces efflorescens]